MKPIVYEIVSSNPGVSTKTIFKKISDYLLTFVGDIELKNEQEEIIKIIYQQTGVFSVLLPQKSQIIINPSDYLTLNLIRINANTNGYRIKNVCRNYFLPQDPNLLEIKKEELSKSLTDIFVKAEFVPVFRYNQSLVFYTTDKKGKIYITNRHLLEYLLNNPKQRFLTSELYQEVAGDIGLFIALSDRGLIPNSFYGHKFQEKNLINLSGLNIYKIYKNIILDIIYFSYNGRLQQFVQTDFADKPKGVRIKKGENIIKKLQKQKSIFVKFPHDITYKKEKNTLIPKINVSMFIK